jgi:hypothetical protein
MTNIILSGLLAATLLVVFYRFAVRPLLRLAFIERIEACEKVLEKMVVDGKANRAEFAYQFLAGKFQAKNHLSRIGISGFLHFLICRESDINHTKEIDKFIAESSPELRQLHDRFRVDLLRWMIINSPSYTILGVAIIGCVMVYKSMNEKRLKDEAFIFADMEASAPSC